MKDKSKSSLDKNKKTKKMRISLSGNEDGAITSKNGPYHGGVGVKINRAINKGLKGVSITLSRWTNRKS